MKIEIDLEEFAEQVKSGQSVTAKGGVLNNLLKQLRDCNTQQSWGLFFVLLVGILLM